MQSMLGLLLLALLAAAVHGQCDKQKTLKKHNTYRAWHSSPKLSWDDGLAADAQAWSQGLADNGCALQHSGGWDGENLYAWLDGGYSDTICSDAVDIWYNEFYSSNYVFSSTPWTDNGNNFGSWGHWSQVIWKSTKLVGCGVANGNNCQVVTCRYRDTGNWMSDEQFLANVLPSNHRRKLMSRSLRLSVKKA